MVKKVLFMALFFLTSSCYAATSLKLDVDGTQFELGKPIPVSIIATNINANLSSLRLTPLYEHFGVEVIEISNKSENNITYQELHINLFPKATGKIKLPPLKLLGNSTKETPITVNSAKTPKGEITFSSSITLTGVWQRQQILLTTTIITPSKFSKLILDDFQDNRIESVKLDTRVIRLSNGTYQHNAGWAIYPQTHGKYSIITPAINYRVSGAIQRKFFSNTLHLNVKELPSYVSPLMPVGSLSIDSTIRDISTDDYSHSWKVAFSSEDISPRTLTSLSLPSSGSTAINFGDTIISTDMKSVTFITPISFESNGIHSLPSLNYKTFNPRTGKLDTLNILTKDVIFLASWVKIILAALAFLVLVKLFYTVYRYVRTAFIRNKDKRNIINSSLLAKSPQQLHAIINQYVENRGWGVNTTLQRLVYLLNNNAGSDSDNVIAELSLACYRNNSDEVSQKNLNKKIYNLLNN